MRPVDRRPTVFLSHASADKDRFVRGFAERLRDHGVKVWYDEWDVSLAEDLVDRVFERGIGTADWVVVVLSRASIESPWVKDETSAAVIRRIAGYCHILPVVLDDVAVPVSLSFIVWQRIVDVHHYDREFARILGAILGDGG